MGMRPGELAGLLWTDLDLDGQPPTLSVSGSMKYADGGKVVGRGDVKRSAAGRRTIALPPHAVKALHEQRRRQDAERDAAGGDLRTAMHRLGHTTPAMTLAVYAGVAEDQDRAAADAVNDCLGPRRQHNAWQPPAARRQQAAPSADRRL
ncbi:hypothetical protein GHK86_02425 [Acidimicrobiaceae bacterium USS-CC1]|uniref:Tyr recombinase domain-containing protein n=1 Tax=Acidiferrimicrobium australe TaxID=2664430 RepID=A0ABW9QQJ8_9ACTN|nr:hypothetical protein [Acidiferrimicrobium australe]